MRSDMTCADGGQKSPCAGSTGKMFDWLFCLETCHTSLRKPIGVFCGSRQTIQEQEIECNHT